MPFDGLGFHGNQSLGDGGRLSSLCRHAANALTLAWRQGPLARRPENEALRQSIEAAVVPELLRAARSLISSEETWVKGRLRTRDGKRCALGAIFQVTAHGPGRHLRRPAVAHLLAVAKQRGFPAIERMNDSSTHADVLAAFDEAICLSEAHRDDVT